MHRPPAAHDARPDRVTIDGELAALERARGAAGAKLARLRTMPTGTGADELSNEYIDAVLQGAIETLQRDLVVFGRLDDGETWRIGLYGVDQGGEQLVVDWRARLAEGFYQATITEPLGFERRVTYLGAIEELFVEEFTTGEITGHSPLLAELSRERGDQMRAAVATLQAEQDRLVRLEPTARLVLRGGPGTGKTVVALHRAAWLAYNDRRPTAGRILALGPSERYLRFVATVLPTLGEQRIRQTTFDRLLGPSSPAASDPRWLPVLDELERSVVQPQPLRVGRTRLDEDEVAAFLAPFLTLKLPWRDRRRTFISSLAARSEVTPAEAGAAVKTLWKPLSTRQAWAKLRNRRSLLALGTPEDLADDWLRTDQYGVLEDEVRSRIEGVAVRFGHVIVDEGQDLSLLHLRAVLRRGEGFTFVGDDAQRSAPNGIGLRAVAEQLDAAMAELATAYRMSAEIAEWLNEHAARHAIDAVTLIGVRPTGRPVLEGGTVHQRAAQLAERWSTVTVLRAEDVWSHKGVEYDAVVVDRAGMDPAEVYLAASRAAHELAVV